MPTDANGGTAARGQGSGPSLSDQSDGDLGRQKAIESLADGDFGSLSVDELLARLQGDFAQVKPQLGANLFPGPIAEEFYWCDDKVAGIQGPVGSGKTTTLLKSRLRRAQHMPPSTIDGIRHYKLLVVRATYRQLWSTTIPDFLKVFPKALGRWEGGRGGPVTFTLDFEDEFGEIEFIAEFMAFGDDIVAALRGYQATDIWCHELDTNPEDLVPNAITRIGRFPGQDHFAGYPAGTGDFGQLVGDMNAMDEDNFAFKLFHDEKRRKEIGLELTRMMREENPDAREIRIMFYRQPGYKEPGCENLANLPASYYPTQIATMKLLGRGDLVDRLVYNKTTYLRVGEPVFQDQFVRGIHVRDLEPIPDLPLRIGLDQGFIGAAVIGQYVHPQQFRIYRELMFPDQRLLAKEFGRRLRDVLDEEFPGFEVEFGLGDMAGEAGSSLAEEENETWNLIVSRTADFPIRAQRIGTNRIQPRLEAVRARLETIRNGHVGLLIDPRCTRLIAGFEARYVWAEEIDKSGDRRKVPNKRLPEANLMDALEYLLLSETLGTGLAPDSLTSAEERHRRHNGGPPLENSGLQIGHDVLNPYGGLH